MREYSCKIKSCAECPAHQWSEKNQTFWCYEEDKEIPVEFFDSFPEFCKLKIIAKERGERIGEKVWLKNFDYIKENIFSKYETIIYGKFFDKMKIIPIIKKLIFVKIWDKIVRSNLC